LVTPESKGNRAKVHRNQSGVSGSSGTGPEGAGPPERGPGSAKQTAALKPATRMAMMMIFFMVKKTGTMIATLDMTLAWLWYDHSRQNKNRCEKGLKISDRQY
jgi:hypothetical protein